MNRLLIVEDEKMIRQGLKVMAQRAPVEIKEIIECRNGEEALEILKSVEVDVMFTDVRMPKKDGITLIKEMQALTHQPYTVIISGFDDFNYAVDALRCGAKEYILKPVEREAIHQVLLKLQQTLEEEKQQPNPEEVSKEVIAQQLKYFLLNPNATEQEISGITTLFEGLTKGKSYHVWAVKSDETIDDMEIDPLIQLDQMGGFDFWIMTEEAADPLLYDSLKGKYIGVSKGEATLEALKAAYESARVKAKLAYLVNQAYIAEEQTTYGQPLQVASETVKRWVQLLGTQKIEELLEMLGNVFAAVKVGTWEVQSFEAFMNQFLKGISDTYAFIMQSESEAYEQIRNYYAYPSFEDYIKVFLNWLRGINYQAVMIYDDSKNKKKMEDAMNYIQANYNKDLNMAMVSNYVSMNYSVFSQLFKEYTGINFVNYLKEIRVEKAKEIITQTDEKIIDISLMVGYENEKHFMKVFKSVVGVSPSEYRKNSNMSKEKII